MARVRRAALLDNLEKLKRVEEIASIHLVTNDPLLAKRAGALGAEVSLNSIPPNRFHLGQELKKLVRERNLRKVFYLSGGGCPLISENEIRAIARLLLQREQLIYTNNTQSADMVAFTVTRDLDSADLPAVDNSLAWALRDHLGLEQDLMPQSLGLLFDLDTPADILVLGAGPFAGPHTRAVLKELDLDYSRLDRAKEVLKGQYQEVALIGRRRAGDGALNAVLKLRLRVFRRTGHESPGPDRVWRSDLLLGLLIEHAGLERFFEYLARVARCAFIDSRVLMAHHRLWLNDHERFLSDLGQWQEISHPWLQRFTRAAVECGIPVILGGHSLVSGSLWALSAELAGPQA